MRSATWFSGWGCSKVGSPDVIYSLNFSPERNERYFCQKGDNKKIGRYFNFDKQLSDLEILDQWNDPQIKGATCGFIKDIFVSVLEDQKTLFHCDAGRDRTGAIAALLSAIVAESTKDLDSRMIGAIECDYQKTKSLDEEKHGRMGYFITQIIRQGGVNNFVSKNCNIDPEVIAAFSKKMRYD